MNNQTLSWWKKCLYVGWIALLFLLIMLLRQFGQADYLWWQLLLSVNFLYLIIKLLLAFLYSSKNDQEYENQARAPAEKTVSVVLPFYNESPESVLQALDSLKQQTYPLSQIIFVDDGSEDLAAYHALSGRVQEWRQLEKHTQIEVYRLEENAGKKAAQEVGLEKVFGDLMLVVDSDGEISVNAVADMVQRFEDEQIGAVVGKIEPRNKADNFLTRMQDVIYTNAFQMGRRAQSLVGSVIVCSGALSMFRTDVILENMDLFQKTRFMGIRCITGDDRLLTMITLKEGYRTVYQASAVCTTDVPTRLKQYLKQQVRWQKSALLFTIYSFRHLYKRPISMVFQWLESYLWLVNLLVALVAYFVFNFHWTETMVVAAIVYNVLVYYLSCLFYSLRSLGWYLIGFVFSFVYGFLLIFVRIYALLTIGFSKWATR